MTFHIYSGSNVDIKWGVDTPFLGGSEVYHIRLCMELAARGHRVVSFTPRFTDAEKANTAKLRAMGDYHSQNEMIRSGGVLWLDTDAAKFMEGGIWIVQRDPSALDDLDTRFAKSPIVRMFAAHDLDYTPGWTSKFDAVLVESQIHARYLQIHHKADNLAVTGAGFPMDLVDSVPITDRKQKRLIYTSSPVRGLLNLLTIFRRAREEDSELELAVTFGMDYLDAASDRSGMYRGLKQKLLKAMDKTPGVTYLGRLPSCYDVWQELAKSSMWVYPTTFNEIACNALMEAQTFGAIPIVSPTMALRENTLHGVVICGNPDDDRLIQARFVREIVGLANNPKLQGQIRPQMMADARAGFDFKLTVDRIEALASQLWQAKTASLATEAVPC